jgi:Protein-L-isoaspartate(D-aspartate) O-methyltransferase (PCMT)
MVGAGGRVWGIDCLPALVRLSEDNMRRDDAAALLDGGRVTLMQRSGWDGVPEAAPFDAIHVGAAAATVPRALVSAPCCVTSASTNMRGAHELSQLQRPPAQTALSDPRRSRRPRRSQPPLTAAPTRSHAPPHTHPSLRACRCSSCGWAGA